MAAGIGVPPWADGSEPCRGLTHVFFPDFTDRPRAARYVELAKSLCAGCPKRLPCQVQAVARNERHGVWGGLLLHKTNGHDRGLHGKPEGVAWHEQRGDKLCPTCRRYVIRTRRSASG